MFIKEEELSGTYTGHRRGTASLISNIEVAESALYTLPPHIFADVFSLFPYFSPGKLRRKGEFTPI